MKYKKMILGFMILITGMGTAEKLHSQILMSIIFGEKLNTEELTFGIHLDQSWNNYTSLEDQSALSSFNLGLFFNYHMNTDWRLNIEMLAKYQRGAKDLPVYDLNDPEMNALFVDGHVNREMNYLSIPVSIQYMTHPGIYAEIGPQVSLRTKAKDIFKVQEETGDLQLVRDLKDDTAAWDFGWFVGIGYGLGAKHLSLVGIRYYGGFSDVSKMEDGNQRNQQWGIYANIPIGRSKEETNSSDN